MTTLNITERCRDPHWEIQHAKTHPMGTGFYGLETALDEAAWQIRQLAVTRLRGALTDHE